MSNWRIIFHPSGNGAWNMAVDEAVLEAVAQNQVLPTLRLYSWDPACLSLGYAQPVSDIDTSALQILGWHLVRRPTGGRSILHTDEITYAVIAPQDEPLVAGGVLESYRRLSAGLLKVLELLGLDARADQAYPDSPRASAVCFETPSTYEVTSQGKKLIGSAQARRYQGVLQHGSLPLFGDLARIIQVLSFPNEAERQDALSRLLDHAATLEQVLGQIIDWNTAAKVFEQAFSQIFHLDFETADLSPAEQNRAQELVAQKYANLEWTFRL
jgi:lipoate-protein ligase A